MIQIDRIKGTGLPIAGNDIDTDRIIPARYLKEITFTKMGSYTFYDERFDGQGNQKPHPINNKKYKNAKIMIVNKNFGCGSSREHAAQAIVRMGIRAIIGESFSPIFFSNCIALGMPAVVLAEAEIQKLMKEVENDPELDIEISLKEKRVGYGRRKIQFDMPEPARKALLNGLWDSTNMLLANKDKIVKTAQNLPYIKGFL